MEKVNKLFNKVHYLTKSIKKNKDLINSHDQQIKHLMDYRRDATVLVSINIALVSYLIYILI
jgi:hypothetical protein